MMRASTMCSPAAEAPAEWEVRPGGMLVQNRKNNYSAVAINNIRVKVKYGSSECLQIYLSSEATFGELKRRLSEKTGFHPQDQKLLFKDKERESSAYLDTSGVKDGSKIVLLEDPAAKAKRLLESRRSLKLEKACKLMASIGLEVDHLAPQVSALEVTVSKGGKVAEDEVMNLIELLMRQLVKLDGIAVDDGDAKLQRGMQMKRVQKFVERLDAIKIKISIPKSNGQLKQQQPKWVTFDGLCSPLTLTSASTTTTTSSSSSSSTPSPRFDWELF